MGFGASKSKKDAATTSKAGKRSAANEDKSGSPSNQRQSRDAANSDNSTSNSSTNSTPPGASSPGESRGFNNPQPARRDTYEARVNNRQTRMVGAEDMNGTKEALDERPFRQEKVSRVPTKALLKPPKNPNSLIAEPEDEYDMS